MPSPLKLPTAGQFRHRVTVQTNTPGKDGDDWLTAPSRDQWALVETLTGEALDRAQVEGERIKVRMTFRNLPVVTAGQRIVFRSVAYNIKAVLAHHDRLQQALCEVVP